MGFTRWAEEGSQPTIQKRSVKSTNCGGQGLVTIGVGAILWTSVTMVNCHLQLHYSMVILAFREAFPVLLPLHLLASKPTPPRAPATGAKNKIHQRLQSLATSCLLLHFQCLRLAPRLASAPWPRLWFSVRTWRHRQFGEAPANALAPRLAPRPL